jgi:maltose O-acetyltransferase
MALRSLNQFLGPRAALMWLRTWWLRHVRGVNISSDSRPSFSSRFAPGRRGSIVIGSETLVAFKTLILARDFLTGEVRPVTIGRHCFIGGGSMILPGVEIGDECIVGAGAVVFDDVPARSIVGGNPARILRRGITIGAFGRLEGADDNSRRTWNAEL